MPEYTLTVNGEEQTVDVPSDTPLLWVLRDELDLTGTKFGCGIAQCGACTVHIDGRSTRSCITEISQADGSEVVTIEGLSEDGDHPVQQAWIEVDVPQCGYCQSGQMMQAAALLEYYSDPSDEEIQSGMAGNICRCGTYVQIRKAVKRAANMMQEGGDQ